MRTAAKREPSVLRVPSRQRTVFQAEKGKLMANSRTETGRCRLVNGGLIPLKCKFTRHETRFSRPAIVRSEGPRCIRYPPAVEVRRLRKEAIGRRFPIYGGRTSALPHLCRSRPFGLPAQRRHRSDPTCSEAQHTFRLS